MTSSGERRVSSILFYHELGKYKDLYYIVLYAMVVSMMFSSNATFFYQLRS